MSADGFLFECIERLGDQAERVFDCINNVFSWLPLAATIEGAIFCVHGGESVRATSAAAGLGLEIG